ncbi:glycosyltransferase family 2 protein [Phlebiopsis gigantea 11061_1 CR5-6]|uniref:Glycosyltransferase family 2 protein n=1 Tax=Phlebiopsis gigantea (strain 11061_1 CR5-6) TaxID=745531 RepID=A0A0C3RWC5_PHLG1|nr:glycosyltransferase family 2 protein [Phlebiopsis gigantea 11061_1 CR5-6]
MDHSKPATKSKCHVLVTGGNGFIGSHIARRYFAMGHPVTVADIASRSHFRNVSPGIETFEGDLRDPDFCARVVRTADIVLHLAANMGGMGTIHEENEAKIYQDNHTITLNILSACVDAGVEKFFYASSACVYPTSLQDGAESDVSLCEHDVWANPPPRPQGLYGLEKLNTELVIQNYATGNMKTYISRFHNIYGPYGSWKDGREKVPAALLRKAIVAKLTGKYEVEVWGDGSQRRSFCYIDDAVEGVLKLLDSDCHVPVNIGSEEAISIDDLARKAAEAVGLDLSRLELQHVVGKPVGVASRNSNNSFVEAELGWKPRIGLQEGLTRTAQWIRDEIDRLQETAQGEAERAGLLENLGESSLVRLRPGKHIFALLLPITSRGHASDADPPACLESLRAFARSLLATTHEETGVPLGLGCVAFTDTTFPGMPTFPVIHRTHMSIFDGQVVPDVFVNQDGDPFLYQLYRRFGCSRVVDCEIRNGVGGRDDARYEKQHAMDWTFGPLTEATCLVESWLAKDSSYSGGCRKLTVDIIVPCYRVMMGYLDNFLSLKASPSCSVMFIIIIDNPASPNIRQLREKYEHRLDVRIRVNKTNSGASASRNRGLAESAAEWVLFLDDDVTPARNLLLELEKSIETSPMAAGFVGNAKFPTATTTFTTALHLAGVTYFWDIATKLAECKDVPWGVTANIAARRDINDGVLYDVGFPKTGGGEDIDFCRRKREYVKSRGGDGFVAAPHVTVTHPYWNNGSRSYWRFYGWSKGDGALVKRYPALVYRDIPNSAELLLFSVVASVATAVTAMPSSLRWLGPKFFAAVFVANILHDAYRHLWRDAERTAAIQSTVTGSRWLAAVVESSLIRMFSEWGRVVGLLERGEFGLLFHRFEWFAGVHGDGPRNEERRNNVQRIGLSVALFAVLAGI